MVRLLGLLSAAWYAVSYVSAISSTGNSVLVILEPKLKREDYSTFFNGLKKRGYSLTFRSPKDVSPAITEYDVPSFSHVILFAPTSKSFASDITPQSLVKLLTLNTNVLFALSPKATPFGQKSGNAQFSQDLASWTFQESLVLRVDSSTHRLASTSAHNVTSTPTRYTVKDDVVYELHVSKFDGKSGQWSPYSGIKDLQLDFTMLDPHVRVDLPAVKAEPGVYRVQFRAPDRHGVFKFVVDWRRKGYTYLESSTTVSVVPPRHDGYPRFLSAAWPYYAGAISTSVGFAVFCTLWLLGDSSQKVKGKKKAE
ncbi:oligosaccharyl transferase glycoprotein complex, beta subunit [Ceratobasidium sp. 392]|nr:oligosaccharyl transferase glycoprotein complex, beta subunit [Ceratobasidium sp. 392]